MTKQEFFTKAETASLNGQFPAVRFTANGERIGCGYRTNDGRACLVGITIPDEEYKPEMECGTALDLYVCFPLLKRHIPEGMTVRDMDDCQLIHDRLANTTKHKT